MAQLSTAGSYISPQDVEKRLNLGDMKYVPLFAGSQIVRRSVRVFKGVYNFAVQGGAIGNINLYDPVFVSGSKPSIGGLGQSLSSKYQPLILPPSFIILNVIIDVITAFAGSSSTVAFSSGVNAADLKAATAIASYTGLVAGIPVNTAASAVKIPVTQAAPGASPYLTVAVGALTAGYVNVHLEGYLSD